jgi:flagellar basal body-associated protein FliL
MKSSQIMKKFLIIIINVILMAAILVFVVLYSGYENRESYRRQIENFENTTVTMERVTENYLEGEQRICDVWARYINGSKMTMKEAAEYIRASHVLADTSAHVISLDNLNGLSTRPKLGTADEYDVSPTGGVS